MEQQQQQQQVQRVDNPYGDQPQQQLPVKMTNGNGTNASGLVEVEARRAAAQVMVAMQVAKQYPRNQRQSAERIIDAFTRPSLAEVAQYEYPRGGQSIKGPSIRSAEQMALHWGNVDSGWNWLERVSGDPGKSIVEAFAWDLETNSRTHITFDVYHIRDKKDGGKKLTEERDIYEHVANYAARRMRACILKLIPGDVVEAAMAQAERTLESSSPVTKDGLKKLLEAFGAYGVTRAMIEARMQRSYDTMSSQLLIRFRGIYQSLKDGMGDPADYFDLTIGKEPEGETRTEQMRNLLLKKAVQPEEIDRVTFENLVAISELGDFIPKASEIERTVMPPVVVEEQVAYPDAEAVAVDIVSAIVGTADPISARHIVEGAQALGLGLAGLQALIQDATSKPELTPKTVKLVLDEINRRATI